MNHHAKKMYADKKGNRQFLPVALRVDACFVRLFACDNAFYLVQFVQCFDRRQTVDVGVFDFVAYLRQHRVVELEERQLHALAHGRSFERLAGHHRLAIVGFELRQNFVGACHHTLGHTGQFGHMYAETVFAATSHEFAHKHHFAVDFGHFHVVVGYTLK